MARLHFPEDMAAREAWMRARRSTLGLSLRAEAWRGCFVTRWRTLRCDPEPRSLEALSCRALDEYAALFGEEEHPNGR
jgi:hypothetical protein